MKNNGMKTLLAAVCVSLIMGVTAVSGCVTAYAEDTQNNEKKDEMDYTLDKEVQEWLDAGNSIPSEAKYCTLASSSHMWMLDDTDISDGKVELTGNDEKRVLAGIALKDWLKTQSFYGEKLGEKDNKVKFKRPKKATAF